MPADREQLRKIITTAPYSNLSPDGMIPVLVSIQQMARLDGLLAFESTVETIDDGFLRRGLTDVIEGYDQVEVAVRCLERLPENRPETTLKRSLLSLYFILLLQVAEPEMESRLKLFVNSGIQLRPILDAALAIAMPYRGEMRNGIRPGLKSVLARPRPFDSSIYYQYLTDLLNSGYSPENLEDLKSLQGVISHMHPFTWGLQEFLDRNETDHMDSGALAGIFRFGFIAKAKMPQAYTMLDSAYHRKTCGAFGTFLLAMLHLYNKEDIPYKPERCLQLLEESLSGGCEIAASWALRFRLNRSVPAFPGPAIPSSVSGTEIFSDGEVSQLVSVLGAPPGGVSGYHDPGKASVLLRRRAGTRDLFTLEKRTEEAVRRKDPDRGLENLRQAAVLGSREALLTIVSAYMDSADGFLKGREDLLQDFRPLILRDSGTPLFLLQSTGIPACRPYLERCIAEHRTNEVHLVDAIRDVLDRNDRTSAGSDAALSQDELSAFLGLPGGD